MLGDVTALRRAQGWGQAVPSWVLGLGGEPGSDLVSKALCVAEGGSKDRVSCQAKGMLSRGKS